MKSYKSLETMNKVLEIIENKNKGAYLRFGDGDLNIMEMKDDSYNRCNLLFSNELKESISINDNNYLIGINLICDKYGLLEPGMFPGNHEWPEKICDDFYKKICAIICRNFNNFYSQIALNYLITMKQPDAIEILYKLKLLCLQNNTIFIGNTNINRDIIKLYFGNYSFIECKQKNSYDDINSVEHKLSHQLRSDKYNIVICCMGVATRVLIKRIWNNNITNYFILDFGSIIDALSGIDSRAYISLTNFNNNQFNNNFAYFEKQKNM
jgi:hypothetical protein